MMTADRPPSTSASDLRRRHRRLPALIDTANAAAAAAPSSPPRARLPDTPPTTNQPRQRPRERAAVRRSSSFSNDLDHFYEGSGWNTPEQLLVDKRCQPQPHRTQQGRVSRLDSGLSYYTDSSLDDADFASDAELLDYFPALQTTPNERRHHSDGYRQPLINQHNLFPMANPYQRGRSDVGACLQAPSASGHRVVCVTKSAEPGLRVVAADERKASRQTQSSRFLMTPESAAKQQRSQSFRHRAARSHVAASSAGGGGGGGDDKEAVERRRSTPNVTRRTSMRSKECRTDVWPEAAKRSVLAEQFLQLPASDDYQRLRQFDIDSRGAVISRGDSFRRRKLSDQSSGSAGNSRSGSVSSAVSSPGQPLDSAPSAAAAARRAVTVFVVGAAHTGKTSLIAQFLTSEHRNPYAADNDDFCENTVSICIEGDETELAFYESDPDQDASWIERRVDAYVVVYSVDSKASFREASALLADVRRVAHSRDKPVLIAANKVDLARKRQVSTDEARGLARTYGCLCLEVSVMVNHGMDELLVGIVAEWRASRRDDRLLALSSTKEASPAIARFSQRRSKHHPRSSSSRPPRHHHDHSALSCAHLANRFGRLFRRRVSRSCNDLAVV